LVRSQLEQDIASFGDDLLKWADAQRATSDREHGSADSTSSENSEPQGAGGSRLTGWAGLASRLQEGENVTCLCGGNSLNPRIKRDEKMLFESVRAHDDIKVKDIVYCQIKGRYWGHVVKRKTFVGGRDEYEYTISNHKGFENGTCTLDHIYGKCIDHWKSK